MYNKQILYVVIYIFGLFVPNTNSLTGNDFDTNFLKDRTNFFDSREGDINIIYLNSVHGINKDRKCSRLIPDGVIISEAFKFAVEEINNRTDILPNITIGYLSLDNCNDGQKALEVSVYAIHKFLMMQTLLIDSNETYNRTSDAVEHIKNPNEEMTHKRRLVVGVLGPTTSPLSVTVAPYFGVFRIPILSPGATSDALSDKTRFEYFLSLATPDRFQILALLEIAKLHGWTYLSVVYTESAYGQNAAAQLDRIVRNQDNEICIANAIGIPSDAGEIECEETIKKLLNITNANVVLAFIQSNQQEEFFTTVRRIAGIGRFLWLSTVAIADNEGENFADVLDGSIYTLMPNAPIPKLRDYISANAKNLGKTNVWLTELIEYLYNCTSNVDSTSVMSECAKQIQRLKAPIPTTLYRDYYISKIYDGVSVYANAINQLIRHECPAAFQEKHFLNDCLDGPKMLAYLKNSSTDGLAGNIQFNSNGDMIGDMVIHQYQRTPSDPHSYKSVEVGNWTTSTNTIFLNMTKLSWNVFRRNDSHVAMPESVCSKPCKSNEYRVLQEISCCWLCLKCRDNEIVNQNATGCQPCPLYTWPDRSYALRASTCNPIPPTYLRPEHPISVTLLLLAIISLLAGMSVAVVYHLKRDHRLVKATSRELSLLILFGTVLASVAVVFFVIMPRDGTCIIRNVGFHVAINFLYGPLLVKNIRTYRIFRAGQKSVKIPVGVGRNTQFIYVACITGIQMIIISISEAVDTSAAMLKMPSTFEMYVEIYCRKTIWWFLVPLAFNISLIVLCAVLGYATRKLPENFNESGFIFVSVATTLFAWLVFIPAYFSAVYAQLQSAILGFCLVLNAYVTLGCQFIRIVYAVYFVIPETVIYNSFSTRPGVSRNSVAVVSEMAVLMTTVTEAQIQAAPVDNGHDASVEGS